ncbi:flagellar hook assembly protein FlgD [Ramlibacter humi]|uniref:Basal-body rod modification protein FlgD n=1 Tax=Ramlibacter humi TaxID=2530451 RepID=A0A4Z0BFJ3_9BURK|nr:flagellar hook capping FlgD N-terminal domain-containing protein [Ramlibacter humi]TFY97077.1 flagellar hook capping protein [Ramlibacter humi]
MAIGSVSAAPAATATPASNLGLQDFLKILLTQLSYQDPLKPMDNQEFMAQIAQFTSLEQTQQLNDKLDQLITNQAALQSVGLIGRTVDVTTSTGQVTGTVSSLSLSGDSPSISVTVSGGTVVPGISLSQILAVR